jgi:hypothetical protein
VAINVESSTASEKELKDVNAGKPASAPPRAGLTIAAIGSGLEENVQAELDHAVGPHGKDKSVIPAYKSRENLRELGKWKPEDEKDFEKASATPKGLQKRIDKLTARNKAAEEELKKFREAATQKEVAERVNLQVDIPGERHVDLASESEQPPAQPPQSSNGAPRLLPEHQVRVNQAANRFADWDETFRGVENITVPVAVTDVLQRLENSADVLYTIAKNPEIAAAIQDPARGVEIVRTISEDIILGQEHAVRMRKNVAQEPLTDEENANAKSMPLSQGMIRAISAQENSAELSRYLVRNQQAYEALVSSRTEAGAIAAIYRLASELAGSSFTKERQQRPRSRLNPPIRPVGGGGTSFIPTSLSEAAETSQAAYRKARGGRAGRFD